MPSQTPNAAPRPALLSHRSRPLARCAGAAFALATLALGVLPGWAQSESQQPAPPTEPASAPAETSPESAPAAPQRRREVEVLLRNGNRLTGMMVEVSKDAVTISIRGVTTRLDMRDVATVRDLPSVEDRYAQLRDSIADDDTDGRLRLARWLLERERYDLALREVDAVLVLEPHRREAKDLKNLLEQQIRVEQATREAAAERAARDAAGGAAADAGDRPVVRRPNNEEDREEFPLLAPDQINLMRVFEVDLKDPPRMIVRRRTVENLLDKYAGTLVEGRGPVPSGPEGRERFLRQSPAEVLSWMFDLRAREFYGQVEVLENPRSMKLFRDNVHGTWLMNACATSNCHGGQEAGRLWLFNREGRRSDRAAYTNFLILDRYRTADGRPLIDYADPARSLLLQYGLPRNRAVTPHPEVAGAGRRWQPAFDGPDDPKFRRAVEWILNMYPNRTGYPVEYTPPVPGPLRGPAGAAVRPGGNVAPPAPLPSPAPEQPNPVEKPPQPR